jgi:hypothetical protein
MVRSLTTTRATTTVTRAVVSCIDFEVDLEFSMHLSMVEFVFLSLCSCIRCTVLLPKCLDEVTTLSKSTIL